MVVINYLIMCFVFGTTFLAIKVGVDAGAPPFMSAGLRFFLAGLILFVVMYVKGRAKWSLLLQKEMLFTGIGLTFGTFATLYWAEQFVSSGIAAVLSATGPMMILLLQALILRQKVSRKSFIGCVVGLIGVIMLLSSSVTFDANIWWFLGCMVILVGELFYACGALYSKQVIRKYEQTSPIALNAAQMMYGGVMLFILSSFTETINVEAFISMKVIGSLLYLIVFGSMIGHTLFYWLVAKTNPIFPSTWLYISPLIAITLGAVLNSENVTWLTGVGVVTIIVGTVLVNIEALQGMLKKSIGSLQKKEREVVLKK